MLSGVSVIYTSKYIVLAVVFNMIAFSPSTNPPYYLLEYSLQRTDIMFINV